MFKQMRMPSGTEVTVIMRQKAELRLSGRCFRGTERRLAGNFYRWESIVGALQDPEFRAKFLEALDLQFKQLEPFQDGMIDTVRFELCFDEAIGWSSTDHAEYYEEFLLEPFQPNDKSSAMRVKPDLKNVPAPATQILTVVVEIKIEADHAVAVIHTLYPGKDVGPLAGDVTKRANCVFFDWQHPGELTA